MLEERPALVRSRVDPFGKLRQRNERLESVPAGGARGVLWICFIAVEFYLFSNPLVFMPGFAFALDDALWFAVAFLLLQLPHLRLPMIPVSVVAFLIFISWSETWSQTPSATRDAAEMYAAIAVVAGLTAAQVTARVMAYGLLAGGVLVMALSSYAAWQQIPGAVLPPESVGVLAGVGTNRNILAYTLALALVAVCMPPRSRLSQVVWAGSIGIVLLGVVLAGSGTGDITAVMAVLLTVALRVAEWARHLAGRVTMALRSLFVLGVVGSVLAINQIASAVGREATTFSGRRPLWDATWKVSQDSLWRGFGWGSVWGHPWQSAPVNHIFDLIFYNAGGIIPFTHGHNSFFDVLPQVGLIGVAIAVLIHFEIVGRALWTRHVAAAAQRGDATDRQRRALTPDSLAASRLLIVAVVVMAAFGLMEPLFTIPVGWFVLVSVASLRTQ